MGLAARVPGPGLIQPEGRSSSSDAMPMGGNVRKLRAGARVAVDIPAVLEIGQSSQSVLIRNLSQGGAAVRGSNGVSPGDRIVLVVAPDRRIAAQIRWSRMGFCGIAFDAPLSIDDSLFGGQLTLNGRKESAQISAEVIRFGIGKIEASTTADCIAASGGVLPRASWMLANALRKLKIIGAFSARRSGTYSQKTIIRACRAQGFSWLAE